VSDAELREELRTLGGELAWPPTPDLAAAVAPRIEARGRAPRRRVALPAMRPAIVVPIVLALLLGAVAAVPPARTAVLRALGLAARERIVRVEHVERVGPAPRTLQRGPAVGRRTSLAGARAAVHFSVRVPKALGAPSEVRVSRRLDGAVTLLYGRGDALTEYRGAGVPLAQKVVGPGTKVVPTTVAGRPAFFLTGAPFRWIALDPTGAPVESTARLVDANVLLFDVGEVGYRLETAGDMKRALAIARSLGLRSG
jgi:hypothetical protein